jgi:hypothetical protein
MNGKNGFRDDLPEAIVVKALQIEQLVATVREIANSSLSDKISVNEHANYSFGSVPLVASPESLCPQVLGLTACNVPSVGDPQLLGQRHNLVLPRINARDGHGPVSSFVRLREDANYSLHDIVIGCGVEEYIIRILDASLSLSGIDEEVKRSVCAN